MEIIGYLSALFIGITLGLIGGGGSTLAVPILVYLFHIEPLLAITYSLFIVGSTSLVGTFFYFKDKLIHLQTALFFGIPSVVAVFITRHYLLPIIPEQLITIGNFPITKGLAILLLFAILMLFSSYKMIRGNNTIAAATDNTVTINYYKIVIQGIFVGLITGIIGAGGGFLIIPVLVLIGKVPMKEAVGTSLFIITINSLIGFFSSATHLTINWEFLVILSTITIVGLLIGIFLSKKINGKKLKPLFGWFILLMGLYIILKEIFF